MTSILMIIFTVSIIFFAFIFIALKDKAIRIVSFLIVIVSAILLFQGFTEESEDAEYNRVNGICESLGAEYGEIGQSWNGSENIVIYGCKKQ